MSIKSKFLKWFGSIRFYKYPMFIIFGGETTYKIKGKHIWDIIRKLMPGDILLRRYDTYLSSLMIPGYWSHVAIYVGNDEIIHAIGEGVVKEHIFTFLSCDDILIMRCKDNEVVSKAIMVANKRFEEKAQYDFEFDLENADKFYCSEFVSHCFDYQECLQTTEKYLLPDKFLDCVDFDIIWKK